MAEVERIATHNSEQSAYFRNLLAERDEARAEVARLRGEGSERGWFCETCRYWDAPYRPEDSEGKVLIYRTCPRNPAHTMFAVTKDWVEKRDARAELSALRERIMALHYGAGDDLGNFCRACGHGYPCATVRLLEGDSDD